MWTIGAFLSALSLNSCYKTNRLQCEPETDWAPVRAKWRDRAYARSRARARECERKHHYKKYRE